MLGRSLTNERRGNAPVKVALFYMNCKIGVETNSAGSASILLGMPPNIAGMNWFGSRTSWDSFIGRLSHYYPQLVMLNLKFSPIVYPITALS